jgi:formylmethanofuran dehydrogenase subunit E
VMPDSELLIIQDVLLNRPSREILSRPGLRVNCKRCGEEIMNEREIQQDGATLCQACAGGGYYRSLK